MTIIDKAKKLGLVAIQVNEKAKIHYSEQPGMAICGLTFKEYNQADPRAEWELCRMCWNRVKNSR